MPRFPLLAAAVLLAPPAFAQGVTVETARGPADLPGAPASVAAYDIAAIDTLDALGVAPTGVPDRLYVDYLSHLAGTATPVGTLFEPDLEALNALAPDLVIVGGRSADQLDSVSALAPAIDMTIPGGDLVTQALARLDAYGTIFGREEEARRLAEGFQAKLQEARAVVADQGDALIVMTNGPKVTAYGAGSRFGWIHQATGFPEAVPGLEDASHGEAISFEFIREADPDWLIVVDRAAAIGEDGERAQQTLDNELVAGTTAWRDGHVIYLDAAATYVAGGGIQSMSRTLDTLIEGIRATGS
ncbi:siderophore ABC transporter substrate-binding protein [Rubellimicrobium arenae]|uniref:siderophore ABC transporter substrate-binding protein n=1 Tax=Rubellimicrobium arenae TaxID=2817372 RepID=UPI001B310532|nr:siderophore ABC transporter substrate-binding protein [Rubellimicrobium arenae]